MTEPQAQQMDVASPCNKICTLNAAEICIGCGRSRMEIAEWSLASRGQRLRIVDAAARRLAELTAAGRRASA